MIDIISLTAIGIFFGLMLSVAKIKLKVDKDPRIEQIAGMLPGANCGACGFPGCNGYATKIVVDGAAVNLCPVSGEEILNQIAGLMGVSVEVREARKARVHCHGGSQYAKIKYTYEGPRSCAAAQQIRGGFRVCSFGCLGLGDCEASCPFGALRIGDGALPIVDFDKCTGCGNCVDACPRGIISLVAEKFEIYTRCMNKEKGKIMRQGCQVGCTACNKCVKTCKEVFKDNPDIESAIEVNDFLATINYDLCINCGKCAEVCPQGVLLFDKKVVVAASA